MKDDKACKAVLILSGGMDSTTLLYDMIQKGFEIYTLSFNYGQRHSKELKCAKKICEELKVDNKVIDLCMIGKELLRGSSQTSPEIKVPHGHYEAENMKITVVPFRNQLFLTLACAYAESIKATIVFYGAHQGDHFIYWDCRPDFINKFKELILLNDIQNVKLCVPYSGMNKGHIVKRGIELNVPYKKTWTCYEGKENACGKCGACQERLESFKVNEVIDPINYETEIDWENCIFIK